ncbi:MAG: hypothetical protein WBM35_13980, partial [Candidatus Electrothrix sp.]
MTTTQEQPPYILPPPLTAAEAACSRKLAKDLRLPEVVADLLCRRGLTSPEAAAPCLEPQLAELPSPAALKGLDAAVEILAETIQAGQPVVIHGDYDVDGITATVLL